MLKKIMPIYTLPGWGFSADIFKVFFEAAGLDFHPLEYYHTTFNSLEEIAKKLGKNLPSPCVLLAWSLGGLIATQIADFFPEKINKIIFLASQPRFLADDNWSGMHPNDLKNFIQAWDRSPTEQIDYFLRLVSFPSRKISLHKFAKKHFITSDNFQLKLLLNLLFYADLRQTYKKINVKTLHIIGRKDAVIQQKYDELQKLKIAQTVIEVIGAGHLGFMMQQNIYIQHIKNFLTYE